MVRRTIDTSSGAATPDGREVSSLRGLTDSTGEAVAELERNGIVLLPNLVAEAQLAGMRGAFESRLRRLRWNNFDGYQKTELFRHMVPDVLTLDQGFVDVALHPLVKGILDKYFDGKFALSEAKGWKSLPTTRDFHGWHADAWYDQEATREIAREVKLGFYLTDVRSGAFNYLRGSHRQNHPRIYRNSELEGVDKSRIVEVTGPAGHAFLFDTTGIHRQGVPMLEPRQAVFYNYHDPDLKLEDESVRSYRYHPLLLNAAFLGDLSPEDHRILGFGNKTHYIHAFERPAAHTFLQSVISASHNTSLRAIDFRDRVAALAKRVLRPGGT